MRAAAVIILVSLAACQSAPPRPLAPETVKAACTSQSYLRANGFLNAVPKDRVTLLDSDLRYEVGGTLLYKQLVKDRRNRFTRKLQGVWSDEEVHTVVYGPIDKRQICLGVTPTFAYVRKSCVGEGAFTPLRERDLKC